MIFNRSYTFTSPQSVEEAKDTLTGKHVDVHKLDFEIMEKDRLLKVIPHAENEERLRILPITHLDIIPDGNGSKIKMTTKPRRIDAGGPYLLVIFCIFCVIAGVGLYLFKREEVLLPALGITAVGLLVFIIFWIKMESGYFDYVRKIKRFVKSRLEFK